jgi:hypothetical protein
MGLRETSLYCLKLHEHYQINSALRTIYMGEWPIWLKKLDLSTALFLQRSQGLRFFLCCQRLARANRGGIGIEQLGG